MRKTATIVASMNVLRQLQKAGHIKLHAHTGKVVRGPFGDVTAWYIDEYVSRSFVHNGHTYEVRYVDGCFNPFVYATSN